MKALHYTFLLFLLGAVSGCSKSEDVASSPYGQHVIASFSEARALVDRAKQLYKDQVIASPPATANYDPTQGTSPLINAKPGSITGKSDQRFGPAIYFPQQSEQQYQLQALYQAIQHGNEEMLLQLLSTGIDIRSDNNLYGIR